MKTSTLATIHSYLFIFTAIAMSLLNAYVLEYFQFPSELIFVALIYGSALQIFALAKDNEETKDEEKK